MTTHNIGTLREKSLHAAVKEWYAQPGDRVEEKVDGYVIDIVRPGLLIEIQTRAFWPLKRKLNRLTETHRVRLVHPIAGEKWIVRVEADGHTRIGRRKSPKRGRPEQVFEQLISIPEIVTRENFTLEVLLIREEEIRCYDGCGSWRHREWRHWDRQLLEVVERRILAGPAEFLQFLPSHLTRPFTNRELSEASGCRLSLTGKMTYCLRKMGVLELVGKRRNAQLFDY